MSVNARLNVNVALNRPSHQVSTQVAASGLVASAKYANDGGHGTNLDDGPCTLTNSETNPWWGVDLGVALYVAGVSFTNRDEHGNVCVYFPAAF